MLALVDLRGGMTIEWVCITCVEAGTGSNCASPMSTRRQDGSDDSKLATLLGGIRNL